MESINHIQIINTSRYGKNCSMAWNCSDPQSFYFHQGVHQTLCILRHMWFRVCFWGTNERRTFLGLGFDWTVSELEASVGYGLHLHCLTQIRAGISGLSRVSHTEVSNNVTESLTRRGGRAFICQMLIEHKKEGKTVTQCSCGWNQPNYKISIFGRVITQTLDLA